MIESMTPTEAARVLADASHYEDALLQRTEGLTVMVWGFVTPAIFLTAAAFSGTAVGSWLWIPWVVAGAMTTHLVWRSAALSAPGTPWERPGLGFGLRWFAFVALMAGAFYVFRPASYAAAIIIVGLAWAGMSAFDLWGSSTRGRVVWAACGVAFIVSGAALLAASASESVALPVTILVTALAPLVAGGYQTLRG